MSRKDLMMTYRLSADFNWQIYFSAAVNRGTDFVQYRD
jgi:hypothetical protein